MSTNLFIVCLHVVVKQHAGGQDVRLAWIVGFTATKKINEKVRTVAVRNPADHN